MLMGKKTLRGIAAFASVILVASSIPLGTAKVETNDTDVSVIETVDYSYNEYIQKNDFDLADSDISIDGGNFVIAEGAEKLEEYSGKNNVVKFAQNSSATYAVTVEKSGLYELELTVIANIKEDGTWIDRLMVDIASPLPESLTTVCKPIVSFPEISMYRATPWGGFDVNPFPEALSVQFNNTKSFCRGGALYSEGIYEDINKVIALELMRDTDISPEKIVAEYCTYHFGEEYGYEIAGIVLRLEDTLSRGTYLSNGERCDYPTEVPEKLYTFEIVNKDLAETLAGELIVIHQKLSDDVKNNWRYKQIYARVIGDATLVKNNGLPSEKSDEIYTKLVEIYHAENAYYFVSPITRDSIMNNRGKELLL